MSTTQIYAQVSIRRLKAVHAVTHPASRELRPLKKAQPAEPFVREDALRLQLATEVQAEMSGG